MEEYSVVPQKYRAYIYRILTAVALVAVGYGVVTSEEAALWVGAAAAVLGNGLATANTSRSA